MKLVTFNNGVIIPTLAFAHYWAGDKMVYDFTPEGVPTPLKLAIQFLFCALCDDLAFYFSHRTLHTPWLYQHVHKIHHKHINTVFYASAYAHPLEFVFGNVLPTVVGPLLLGKRIHFTTVIAWFFFRNIEAIEGHCGYEFPWSPFRWVPFQTPYGYHSYHHSSNVGNYSSFFHIWDSIMGTNKVYFQALKDLERDFKKESAAPEKGSKV